MRPLHLILGMGEIGRALYKILYSAFPNSVYCKDVTGTVLVNNIDILHICYPWSDKFVDITKDYIKEYNPQAVIIHSTVPIGTTRKCGNICVNSPCRGRHPHLEEGLRTFEKFIGGTDEKLVQMIKRMYAFLEIPTFVCDTPEDSEAAKLYCTTYYGWVIVFEKELKKKCEELGLNFEQVYSQFNHSYNDGYSKLGENQFIRPVLKHMDGKIGGHCVIPNAKILWETVKSDVAKFILDKNETY